MITTRKASERGHFDFGWLDTYHTFSFGEYHDRNHMGFRALRVINEDRVAGGDGQRMSAGSGIRHSEGNASQTDPVHLLQIWILPEKNGIQPGYEQKSFPREEKLGKLRVIASPDGRDGSVTIHQDASLHVALLERKQQVTHTLGNGRYGWLQVARGSVKLNGKELKQGDGAAISDEKQVTIEGVESAEVLLFDLA